MGLRIAIAERVFRHHLLEPRANEDFRPSYVFYHLPVDKVRAIPRLRDGVWVAVFGHDFKVGGFIPLPLHIPAQGQGLSLPRERRSHSRRMPFLRFKGNTPRLKQGSELVRRRK